MECIASELDDAATLDTLCEHADVGTNAQRVEQPLERVDVVAAEHFLDNVEQAVVDVHDEMVACDNVFKVGSFVLDACCCRDVQTCDTMMQQCEHSLNSISTDMRSEQSHGMQQLTQQLAIRRYLLARLSQFIDDIIISKQMIQ
jgi:hypothetical protein